MPDSNRHAAFGIVAVLIFSFLTTDSGRMTAAAVDYFVVPEILHWEDRNTEWSGKKDVIEIKITVVDAASGSALASSVISGKSKWATFGGDHPQDLLPKPLQAYVDSLY